MMISFKPLSMGVALAMLCVSSAQSQEPVFSILAGASNGPVFKTNSEVRVSIALKNTTNHLGDHPKPANEGHLKTGQRDS
jgi:hypothetical protein